MSNTRAARCGAPLRARERLIRREKPPHRKTLIGLVKSLTSEDSDAEGEAGSIVMTAEAAGRTGNGLRAAAWRRSGKRNQHA